MYVSGFAALSAIALVYVQPVLYHFCVLVTCFVLFDVWSWCMCMFARFDCWMFGFGGGYAGCFRLEN